MDIYHIWCNLKPGVGDLDFCAAVDRYSARTSHQGQARHRVGRSPSRQEKAAQRSPGYGQGLRRRARPARRDP